jgi:hypothetical protein
MSEVELEPISESDDPLCAFAQGHQAMMAVNADFIMPSPTAEVCSSSLGRPSISVTLGLWWKNWMEVRPDTAERSDTKKEEPAEKSMSIHQWRSQFHHSWE